MNPLVVILDLLVERSEFGHGGDLEILRPFAEARGGVEALLLTPQCQSVACGMAAAEAVSAVATGSSDGDGSEVGGPMVELDERSVPEWDDATPFIVDRTVELGSGWARLRRIALPAGEAAIGAWLGSIGPDAVVCSGSRRNVSRWEPWMQDASDLMRISVETDVPTLGICFGHQLLCAALGGEVERAAEATHSIADVEVTAAGAMDPLLSPFARNGSARGLFTHQEHVTTTGEGTTILATAPHSEAAVVRFDVVGDARPAWGVQFHPEATEGRLERAFRLGHISPEEAEAFAGEHDGAALLGSFAAIALALPPEGRPA